MQEFEVAVGFVWGAWERFHVHARTEAEAHQKILEKEAFPAGVVSFTVTLDCTDPDILDLSE